MRTLSKLKLNQFSKDELDQRRLNALKGGCACTYGCSNCDTCPSLEMLGIGFDVGLMVSVVWAPNQQGGPNTSQY